MTVPIHRCFLPRQAAIAIADWLFIFTYSLMRWGIFQAFANSRRSHWALFLSPSFLSRIPMTSRWSDQEIECVKLRECRETTAVWRFYSPLASLYDASYFIGRGFERGRLSPDIKIANRSIETQLPYPWIIDCSREEPVRGSHVRMGKGMHRWQEGTVGIE